MPNPLKNISHLSTKFCSSVILFISNFIPFKFLYILNLSLQISLEIKKKIQNKIATRKQTASQKSHQKDKYLGGPYIRYSRPFLKWTREEFQQMNQRTWKFMTINKALYVPRKNGRRGLARIQNSVNASPQRREDDIKKAQRKTG